MHQRAGDGDRAFQGVNWRLFPELVAQCRQQAVLGGDDIGAGVKNHEATRAIGIFGFARAETGLAHRRRLLVPQVATDGQGFAEGTILASVAVDLGRRANLRQHRQRDAHNSRDLLIPGQGVEVHQHRPRGVGHIGHTDASIDPAGQLPDQPGINIAENRLARFGRLAQAGDVVEQPLDLQAGEVSRQRQAHLGSETVPPPPGGQLGHNFVVAGILPDQRVVVRLARFLIPDHRRFPLVGNTYGSQIPPLDVRLDQGCFDHRLGTLPNLQGVVLYPTGLGVNLLMFQLLRRYHLPAVVEDHTTGAGSPLVNSGYVSGHQLVSSISFKTPIVFSNAFGTNDETLTYSCSLEPSSFCSEQCVLPPDGPNPSRVGTRCQT